MKGTLKRLMKKTAAVLLTSVEKDGCVCADGMLAANVEAGLISWINSSENRQESGTLFRLTFTVDASASAGEHEVSVALREGGAFSGESGSTAVSFVSGSVNVTASGGTTGGTDKPVSREEHDFNSKGTCKTCGYGCDHDFKYEAVKKPTETGLRRYTCRICGYTYTEKIPALGKSDDYVELSTVCEVSNGTAEVSFSLTSAQNGLRAANKASAAGLRAEAKTDEKNILPSVFRLGVYSAEVIAASGKPLALVGAGGGRIELSQELLRYFSGSRRLYIHFDPIFTVLGYGGERQSGEITATVRELTDDELRGQLEAAGVLAAPALTYACGLFYTVSTDASSLLCSGGVTVDIPVSPRFYEPGARYTVVHTFAGMTQVLSGECVSKDGSLHVEVQTEHPGYFTAACEKAHSAAA